MNNPNTKSLNLVCGTAGLIGLLECSLTLPFSVQAYEDPPGCSVINGGNGANYQSGLNFRLTEAHVGDAVPVFPMFGMEFGACRAIHVTGIVYTATGKCTNFLNDATLDPGIFVVAPAPPCEPGPYNILITPELVGAGVSSPHGSVEGLPKTVRAMENVEGTALSGEAGEPLAGGFHTATISIVTPDIQVFQQYAYPPGQTCFQAGQNIECTGLVTNSGDITLTNVLVINPRTGSLQLFDPTNGLPFPANVVLPPGAHAVFSNSFMPTTEEIGEGSATTLITATAQDTTEIGGPNASVTNSTWTSCAICVLPLPAPPLSVTLTAVECTADRQFRFAVTGLVGVTCVIQATTNPDSANWLPLCTNSAPFTFVDRDAALYPQRFYRAMVLPEDGLRLKATDLRGLGTDDNILGN